MLIISSMNISAHSVLLPTEVYKFSTIQSTKMCTKDLSIHTINTRPSQIVLVIISFRACFNVFFMQHLHERYGLSCQPSTNKGMYNVKLNCVFGSVELL